MISEHINDNISLQIKCLNIVIPILMHFCSFVSLLCVNLIRVFLHGDTLH